MRTAHANRARLPVPRADGERRRNGRGLSAFEAQGRTGDNPPQGTNTLPIG
jgi:hypothetical protein